MRVSKSVLATAFLYAVLDAAAGEITYELVPRPGSVDLWSLDGGSITTDGTLGEISLANIILWELLFSSPAGQSAMSSRDHAVYLIVETFSSDYLDWPDYPPSLTATDSQIAVNADGGILELAFTTQNLFAAEFTGKVVGFFSPLFFDSAGTIGAESNSGYLVDNAVDSTRPYHPTRIDSTLIPGPERNPNRSNFTRPPGPAVIARTAAVPEPTCWQLVVAGFIVGLCISRQSLHDSIYR